MIDFRPLSRVACVCLWCDVVASLRLAAATPDRRPTHGARPRSIRPGGHLVSGVDGGVRAPSTHTHTHDYACSTPRSPAVTTYAADDEAVVARVIPTDRRTSATSAIRPAQTETARRSCVIGRTRDRKNIASIFFFFCEIFIRSETLYNAHGTLRSFSWIAVYNTERRVCSRFRIWVPPRR